MTRSARNTPIAGALPIARIDVERVFTTAHPILHPRLSSRAGRSGALIAMLHLDGRVEAATWIRARRHRPRCAIVGRHPRCAVALPGASELSLRHVAVLVRSIDERVELRVLDIVSGWGFFSEDGVPLESITTDGTAFFQIGPYVLAVIVTGGGEAWPAAAADAYRSIPPREFLDCRRMEVGRGAAPERAAAGGPRSVVKQMSGVMRIPAEDSAALDVPAEDTGLLVVRPQDLSDEDAPEDEIRRALAAALRRELVGASGALGELVITAHGRHEVLPIGGEALDRGVVLGRYARCAHRGPTPLASPSLSRIHLLVTRSEDQILAYDTASANGSWDRSLAANGVELHKGRVVRLGAGEAYVSWV